MDPDERLRMMHSNERIANMSLLPSRLCPRSYSFRALAIFLGSN
jgi:hypothetical protein